MAFAIVADITARWGENTLKVWLDQLDEDALDEGKIAEALATVESEILGYLTARYSLPLPTVPPILKAAAVEMVPYYLATGSTMTEEVEKRYAAKVALLKLISKGDVRLGVPLADAPSEAEDMAFHDPGTFNEFGKMGGRNLF